MFVLFLTPATLWSEVGSKNRIDVVIERRLAMGETPNLLIKEKSPYLLQHAFNPVNWMVWGDEAFDRAASEDKPIFLSIGYSTCHWCHVMAEESFEDPAVAELLNEWFISIKVDREERPDVDQMYLAATQALSGSSGWPMSVFLMPDGSPFYAGTYFPPTPSHSQPSFSQVLTALHDAWENNRSELLESSKNLVEILKKRNESTHTALEANVAKKCLWLLAEDNDPTHGGFGEAPKFPRPSIFTFLFTYFSLTGDEKAKNMALHTLDKMAAGGIYDHLGGGFHRYSVDKKWFVPHFEKMLYDQAQLAVAYLDGYHFSSDESYRRVVRELFDYLIRDMSDSEGGFYSAEDADSDDPYEPGEHGEGAFYLWTEADIDGLLEKEEANLFRYSYGLLPEGNVEHDPLQEFTGKNILSRARGSDDAAERFSLTPEAVEQKLAVARAKLFSERSKRRRPHLDDKIITSWNGLLVAALARGSWVLQDPELLTHAEGAASFIKKQLYDEQSATLLRRYRNGHADFNGQLDDYASLVYGLIELYRASQAPTWLRWALDLTHRQIELFWNEDGGYFYDSVADDLINIRMKGGYDGAEPAGNSLAVSNLFNLASIRDNKQWRAMAERVIESFGTIINRYPPALPLMLSTWQKMNAQSIQVVIAGIPGNEELAALWRSAETTLPPGTTLLLADGGENQQFLAEKLGFIKTITPLKGKPAAYLCIDATCSLPITAPETLKETILSKTAPHN